MSSKVNSIEERVKLPPTDTISRCYQPQQGNRKLIRILTVAVYVLCVSLAAIMLSLYYIFIWDPTIRPFVTKSNNCDKIIIPEKIAIRLLNSSEVTAEQFYKHILEQYRILYQLQQQRQQFLQKQHLQLQQLAAASKFQEIFATATIIQAQANERPQKPVTPTNGTFLFAAPANSGMMSGATIGNVNADVAEQQQVIGQLPILDAQQTTINAHVKRKPHRKHYNNNNNNNNNNNHHTHRRNTHRGHSKVNKIAVNTNNNNNAALRPALNEPVNVENTPATLLTVDAYTPIPIPLILGSSSEDKRSRAYGDKRGSAAAKRRTTTPTYLNPFLTGELIFEK